MNICVSNHTGQRVIYKHHTQINYSTLIYVGSYRKLNIKTPKFDIGVVSEKGYVNYKTRDNPRLILPFVPKGLRCLLFGSKN